MRAVEECYRSSQVRVFRLNRSAVVAALKERALRLLDECPEVLQIRLFGSLARGDAGPGSDADVLIVLRDAKQPFPDRIPNYTRYLTGIGIGCDVFPYTTSELEHLRRQGPFGEMLATESVVLAERCRSA